ncbi:extracellular solute-binding protein [Iodidimonas sp. SYSU 1G8]|uniref:extracellular solute-binding protein n=1 Tax=Iodidimonas sp. SYSU 1G8 TaxID=3133967 RepID=UPI0031FF3A58
MRAFIPAALAAFLAFSGTATCMAQGAVSHGLSAFGELKYTAGFKHFDYVNPAAPKGGTLALTPDGGSGSFDSLNAFILEGDYPQGIQNADPRSLVFDSLMTRAWDEPDAVYGLVAESAELAPDRTWAIFNLRPQAKWHDGTPITAADVVFTFKALKEKGHPQFAVVLADVLKAEALGPRRVKFSFDPKGAVRDLPMTVAELPILSKAYYDKHDFTKPSLTPPLTSGPYKFGKVVSGSAITYERVKTYWGKDLPVNVGRMNFDAVRVEYFRDRAIAMEAFLAGAYDFREEYTSKTWATEYKGPGIDRKWILRDTLKDNRPSGAQVFFINLRRDKFKDVRVREALDLAFDFEWTNRAIFYGAYGRTSSIFENSELAAKGMPSAAELRLLEPFRKQVPAAVFGPAYTPPKSDGNGANRDNLRKAALLLREAGFTVRNGVVTTPDGKPFTVEILNYEPGFERVFLPYIESLKRIGIQASLRTVDPAQYEQRIKQFDFDMTTTRLSQPLTPGVEQRALWSSAAADTVGSFNKGGIKDPVVDALLTQIINARDRPSLIAACRALDRVLMHNHYMVPQYYKGSHTIAWWDRYGRPARKPAYSRGTIDLWWLDADKAAKLAAARGKN